MEQAVEVLIAVTPTGHIFDTSALRNEIAMVSSTVDSGQYTDYQRGIGRNRIGKAVRQQKKVGQG